MKRILLAVSLLPSQAFAVEQQECFNATPDEKVSSFMSDMSVTTFGDVGGGLTDMWYGGSVELPSDRIGVIQVMNCSNGDDILVDLSFTSLVDDNNGDAVKAILNSGSFENPNEELQRIAPLFQDLGFDVEHRYGSTVETCACALYYPTLRGGKLSYGDL